MAVRSLWQCIVMHWLLIVTQTMHLFMDTPTSVASMTLGMRCGVGPRWYIYLYLLGGQLFIWQVLRPNMHRPSVHTQSNQWLDKPLRSFLLEVFVNLKKYLV